MSYELIHSDQQKEPGIADTVQTKLKVGEPDSEMEQEADDVADTVMQMVKPAPPMSSEDDEDNVIMMKPDSGLCPRCRERMKKNLPLNCPDCEEKLQMKPVSAQNVKEYAPHEISQQIISSKGNGGSISPQLQQEMSSKIGADFSDVSIHTDTKAIQMNQELGARAFTTGSDIYFNQGEYNPENSKGKRLLAHELTHVVQQNSMQNYRTIQNNVISKSGAFIQREPYTTRGIDLTGPQSRSTLSNMSGASYWEQRTFQAFQTTIDSRMTADDEERDAVLSAFWATNPPANGRSASVQLLPVASRTIPPTGGGQTQTAPQLLYKVTIGRPASQGGLPTLEFKFITSGATAVAPTTLPAVPNSFTPTTPSSSSFSGFPGSGNTALNSYWTAHPQEHRSVFHHIQNTAPANFNELVEATTKNSRGRVTHRSLFMISGQHNGNTVNSLNIELINEGAFTTLSQQSPPSDYRTRDRFDLEFERLRARSSAADRLGTVTIPSNIPPDEVHPVKYVVWQYFDAGNARNTEVDAIIPIGTGSRTALYTFTFGANNDVSITRIGEEGTGAGQIDIDRISVTRVTGFPGANAATSALRTWWSTRYPHGGTLTPDPPAGSSNESTTAPTPASLIAEMDQLITNGITNRTWFQQNYGIEVMDATGTETRLQNTHNVPATMTNDTIDFSNQDMKMLELALQRLTRNEINLLQGVKLGRKTSSIRRSGSNFAAGNPNQYGLTLMNSSGSNRDITVLYFQSLYQNNDRLFRGSTADNLLPDVTMSLLHELGHATLESNPAIETAFNNWIAANPQSAPTWYAASASSEMFPELYALFQTDPHFLCSTAPQVYAWLQHVATHGNAPAQNTTLTPPSPCPP